MYKKFINCFLTAAIVVAGTMFTSCQDYESDIKDLREQINAQNINLTQLIDEKISSVESEISSLTTQLADLDAAYKAADEVLNELIETAEENAKAYADMVAAAALESAQAYADAVAAAAEQAAKDYADIQAAQALESAIAAAEAMVAQAIIDLEAELAEAVATLDGRIDGVEDEIAALKAELTQKISDLQESLGSDMSDLQESLESDMSNLYNYLMGLIGEMDDTVADILDDIDDIKDRLDKNDIAIADLIAADAALQTGIDEAKAAAANAQEQAGIAYQLASDLAIVVDELYSEFNDLCDDLNSLLSNAITDLNHALTELNETVVNFANEISILNANVEDVLQQAAENSARISILETYLGLLDTSNEEILNTLQTLQNHISEYGDYITALTEMIEENQKEVEVALASLEEELKEEIAKALSDAEAYVDDEVDKLVEYIDGKIEELDGKVDALDLSISELSDYANTLYIHIIDLQATVTEQAWQIERLWELLEDIYSLLYELMDIIGSRLSSLVFVPTTYVNGIESICFNNDVLSYTAWTVEDGTAPTQNGGTYTLPIPAQAHVVEYLYTPSNVSRHSIESLAYVSNTATEITKAVSETAPIRVSEYEFTTNENNVNVLAVTVELVGELPTEANTFTTVALKATIDDTYKLESELDTEVAVFSDWVRVYNVGDEVTPYIHNAYYTAEPDDNSGDENEHWYDYEAIYANGGGTADNPALYPGPDVIEEANTIANCVAADVAYYESFDLNTLVTVCDKKGGFYDLDSYGLAFEFSLVDFYCDFYRYVDDYIENQADYASITDGVISSVGESDGDAIDRYPVIRITLVDTNNDNAIVDVRYFAIHWTEEPAN